jgi:hypothetical protein
MRRPLQTCAMIEEAPWFKELQAREAELRASEIRCKNEALARHDEAQRLLEQEHNEGQEDDLRPPTIL